MHAHGKKEQTSDCAGVWHSYKLRGVGSVSARRLKRAISSSSVCSAVFALCTALLSRSSAAAVCIVVVRADLVFYPRLSGVLPCPTCIQDSETFCLMKTWRSSSFPGRERVPVFLFEGRAVVRRVDRMVRRADSGSAIQSGRKVPMHLRQSTASSGALVDGTRITWMSYFSYGYNRLSHSLHLIGTGRMGMMVVAYATGLEHSVCADAVPRPCILDRCGAAIRYREWYRISLAESLRLAVSDLHSYQQRVEQRNACPRHVLQCYACTRVWARIIVSVVASLESSLACQMITAPAVKLVNSRWRSCVAAGSVELLANALWSDGLP